MPVRRRLDDYILDELAEYESPEWKQNKASNRYRNNLRYKVVNALGWYTAQQERKLDNMKKASKFRFLYQVSRVLRSLRAYVEQCQTKHRNNTLA